MLLSHHYFISSQLPVSPAIVSQSLSLQPLTCILQPLPLFKFLHYSNLSPVYTPATLSPTPATVSSLHSFNPLPACTLVPLPRPPASPAPHAPPPLTVCAISHSLIYYNSAAKRVTLIAGTLCVHFPGTNLKCFQADLRRPLLCRPSDVRFRYGNSLTKKKITKVSVACF